MLARLAVCFALAATASALVLFRQKKECDRALLEAELNIDRADLAIAKGARQINFNLNQG